MKILLVNPRSRLEVRRSWRLLKDPPHLGLETVKALTPAKHEVKIINEREQDINFNEYYDLVGFTALTSNVNRAYELALEFKAKVKTVIGGIHASVLPYEALAQGIDYVVCGKAEAAWPQFLADFEQKKGNLEKRIYRAEAKQWITPSYENSNILKQILERQPIKSQIMFGSGGCPYNCKFCSVHSAYGAEFWLPAVEEALEKIKKIQDPIFIANDNLFGNKRFKPWIDRFVEGLISLRKSWVAQTDLASLTREFVPKLAKAGCKALYTGLESLNPANLIEMKKLHNLPKDGFSVEEWAAEKIKLCQEYGIATVVSTIIGFDNDDERWFEKTIDFYKKTKVSVPQVYILTPLPGTTLRKELLEKGKKLSPNWDFYDCLHPTFRTKNFSEAQLQDWIDTFYKELYPKRAVIKNLSQLIKDPSFSNALTFGVNLGYNLFSKLRDKNKAQLESLVTLNKVNEFVNKCKLYGKKISYRVYPKLKYWVVDSGNKLVKELFLRPSELKLLDRFNLYLKLETGLEPERV